jgi:hypothetical protein
VLRRPRQAKSRGAVQQNDLRLLRVNGRKSFLGVWRSISPTAPASLVNWFYAGGACSHDDEPEPVASQSRVGARS